MFSVMRQNGFLRPSCILTGKVFAITLMSRHSMRFHTGFIFGAEALSVVARSVTKLLQDDPQIVYLLDRERLSKYDDTAKS